MKQRFLIVVVFALAVSAAASIILYKVMSSQMASNQIAPTTKVVVASRNLVSGELLKDSDVKLADWVGAPPPGAILKVEDAVNRGVVQETYQGEAVLDSRLAAKGAGAGLSAIIPQGMRAVAVRVNDVVGVSGFATTGQHVDVLIAGNPPGNNSAGTVTKTLLQNIEILSAGQNIQKDAEGKPVSVAVVNLLVTPEQAEIMSLASNEARIQLILRNPTDKVETKTPGTSMAYLFTGVKPAPDQVRPAGIRPVSQPKPPPPPPAPVVEAPKPPPPPPPITVEVYTGSKKTETKFQGEDGSQGKAK